MVKIAVLGCGQIGIKVAGNLACFGNQVAIYDSSSNMMDQVQMKIERDKRELSDEGLLHKLSLKGNVICLNLLKEAVYNADYVFEMVTENMEVKKKLFADISQYCPITAVICTSTMNLDINEIVEETLVPERTMGLRFLYPVYCIPEVEITLNRFTSATAIESVRNLLNKMGKHMFFRNGIEPLILTYEQIQIRKKEYLEQFKKEKLICQRKPNFVLDLKKNIDVLNYTNREDFLLSPSTECAICMDRPRDGVFCPCHHMITCYLCARSILNRSDTCPICRNKITDIIRIYQS